MFFGKVRHNKRCRIPYNGEWVTLEEEDVTEDFFFLPFYIKVLFDSVLEYFNEGGTKPFSGGYYAQPKIFWELKKLGDSVRNRYRELEEEARSKNGKR